MTTRYFLPLAFIVFAAETAFGGVRFDGGYYRTTEEPLNHHLRFYADGAVISTATYPFDTPRRMAPWFHQGAPHLSQGRYSVRQGFIEFTLKHPLGQSSHYAGRIGSDYLSLHCDGAPDKLRYKFVRVLFPR